MKESTRIESIDAYIKQFKPSVQGLLQELRKVIRARAKGATERIAYRMPTFHLGENLVHFAAYERHVGFYPTPSAIAAFRGELKKYKHAKGSVQFPIEEPLPLDLISRMVDFRLAECTREGAPPKRRGDKKGRRGRSAPARGDSGVPV